MILLFDSLSTYVPKWTFANFMILHAFKCHFKNNICKGILSKPIVK